MNNLNNIENKEITLEQPTIVPESVTNEGTDDKNEVDSFGKFKTAQDLKSAYQKLEQEFTRKSQKLKELEGKLKEKEEDDKWARKVKDFQTKYPVSQSLGEEIAGYIKENGLISDEKCLEKALLNVLIQKYEGKVGNTQVEKERAKPTPKPKDNVPHVISSGEVPVAPSPRPLTVKEANKLATERLKQIKK